MRGVRLGRILLIAAIVELIALLANAVTTLATNAPNGVVRWLAPPAVALAAALGKAVVDAVGKENGEHPAPGGGTAGPPPPGRHPGPYAAAPGRASGTVYPGGRATGSAPVPYPVARGGRSRARGTPALAAILVLLLACGGGGIAVTAGARYAIGWVSGKEAGPDRLAAPVSGRAGDLTVTVEQVLDTAHFTRVGLTVNNTGEASLSLPLYHFCVFTLADGTVLEADAFRSQWSDTVPPGVKQKGTVTFGGRLPRGSVRASLSFSTVFGQGGGGALTVRAIDLRPA